MFDHFRIFFLGVFQVSLHILAWETIQFSQLHIAIYVVPVCVRFRHDPLLAILVLLGAFGTWKSYPTLGDAAVWAGLLGCCPEVIASEFGPVLRDDRTDNEQISDTHSSPLRFISTPPSSSLSCIHFGFLLGLATQTSFTPPRWCMVSVGVLPSSISWQRASDRTSSVWWLNSWGGRLPKKKVDGTGTRLRSNGRNIAGRSCSLQEQRNNNAWTNGLTTCKMTMA